MSSEYVAHEETFEGFKIKIIQDTDAEDPRKSCDNAGTMVCFHGRYSLGDGEIKGKESFDSPDAFEEWWKENGAGGLRLPLYAYEHGGITIKAGAADSAGGRAGNPFSCPWDSGQIGFIFITRADILKEWGHGARVSKKARTAAEKCLRAETEEYDDYLTGNVYGFQLEDEWGSGAEEDSCWGFIGDPTKYVLEEARSSAKYSRRAAQEKEALEHVEDIERLARDAFKSQSLAVL